MIWSEYNTILLAAALGGIGFAMIRRLARTDVDAKGQDYNQKQSVFHFNPGFHLAIAHISLFLGFCLLLLPGIFAFDFMDGNEERILGGLSIFLVLFLSVLLLLSLIYSNRKGDFRWQNEKVESSDES